MNDKPRCTFRNKYMDKPCGKHLLKNINEFWCLDHGTIYFVRALWDFLENPNAVYDTSSEDFIWSDREISKLMELEDRGLHSEVIAKILGRSKDSVYYKLWEISMRRTAERFG